MLSFSAWGARPYPNTWNVTVNVGALCFPLSSSGVARLSLKASRRRLVHETRFWAPKLRCDDLRGSYCCGGLLLCCENLIVMYSISLDDEMVRKRRTSVMLNVGSAWRRPPSISFEYSARNQPPEAFACPRTHPVSHPSSDLNRLGADSNNTYALNPQRSSLRCYHVRRASWWLSIWPWALRETNACILLCILPDGLPHALVIYCCLPSADSAPYHSSDHDTACLRPMPLDHAFSGLTITHR